MWKKLEKWLQKNPIKSGIGILIIIILVDWLVR